LSDAKAEFMVIGGYAVAHHGHVRATKDIDVFVRPTVENATRVMRALEAFGAPLGALQIGADDFATPGKVQTTGRLEVDGRTIAVIGLGELLKNKRAAGRPQDLADVASLERLQTP
jgi:hypothetical protein